MEKKTMGSFLAALRKAKGMTQKELAELLNVSDKAISRWERDESMPDILLIPVLADIFEVSCDDLLRGEKIAKETFEESSEKRTQRLKALLKKSKSKFQAFSMISVGVAVLGFLLAVILNFMLHKATLGFFCALIGILAGGITQTAFYFYFKGEVDTEEMESPELITYKKYVRDHTLHILYFLGVMLGICLPLLFLGQISYADYIDAILPDGYQHNAGTDSETAFPTGTIAIGLQPKTWLVYGGISGFISILLCFFVDNAIKNFDVKHGRFGVTIKDIEKSKKELLRLVKHLLILAILLAITAYGSRIFEEQMPEYLKKGTQFETFEEFYLKEGTQFETLEEFKEYIEIFCGDYGELLSNYRFTSENVIDIEIGENNKQSITIYTEEDLSFAKQKVENMMWIWTVAMVVECFVVVGVYLKKRQKLD